jgi:hypothetical protein
MNVPTHIGQAEPLHGLAWWAAEAERAGTDWRNLLLTTLRKLELIAPCPICEREPCLTPSFCELCREADSENSEHAGKKSNKINHRHSENSEPRPRPTPEMTIEAVKEAVRARGERALSEFSTLERLRLCDGAALARIDAWLLKRGIPR